MSIVGWRIVIWVLSVLSLVSLVYTGHKSFETPGMLNWEFVAFVLSTIAYTKCIRLDEKLSIQEEKNG